MTLTLVSSVARLFRRMSRANFFKRFSVEYLYYLLRRAIPYWIAMICSLPGIGVRGKPHRPIFLLGMQGGGLTLISRILRRNEDVVSVSGGCRYWSGADELNSVLGGLLPAELASIEHRYDLPDDIILGTDWHCGIDSVLPLFRNADISEKQKNYVIKIIHNIGVFFSGNGYRFIDKSQNFSLKGKLLLQIFEGTDPILIFFTRNPYALCRKVAEGEYFSTRYFRDSLDYETRLRLACEAWENYVLCFEADTVGYENSHIIPIESMFLNLKEGIESLCNICDVDFSHDLLPAQSDSVPFGSRRRERWFPVQTDINKKYLDDIDDAAIDLIRACIGETAERFGYFPPRR